ncbi:DUF1643 domain-containing protein [Salinicoccus sp. HZC-1]|uniref:DUF1643 domain-containing protein n=1 Tax=Salinicoccus sp. HZC-1 TaxID=3385497 RepID=UPI00398A6D00
MSIKLNDGYGYAIFDNHTPPQNRYYLEKRWDGEGGTFTAILTNPSMADSLSTDPAVKELYDYARYYSNGRYNRLIVVNIIPTINPSSQNLESYLKKEIVKYLL